MTDPKVGEFKIEFTCGEYCLYQWSETGHGIYDVDKPVSLYIPMPHRYEPGWERLGNYPTFHMAEANMRSRLNKPKPRFYTSSGKEIEG